MTFSAKLTILFSLGALCAATAYLWLNFGGEVYAAMLLGAVLRCF